MTGQSPLLSLVPALVKCSGPGQLDLGRSGEVAYSVQVTIGVVEQR